jgi:endonuclease YncB( thermonuclease family)
MVRRIVLMVIMLCSIVSVAVPGRVAAASLKGLPDGVQEAKIVGYNDGDKFEVSVDGKTQEVNLLGADAPELDNGDLGECFAKDAKDYVAKLLKKKQVVYLEKDNDDKDGKDRLLRYVWAANSTNTKAYMVDEFLIARGYASFKSRDRNTKYDSRLEKAQSSAKKSKVGLWGACAGPHAEITPVPKVGTGDNPAPVGTAIEGDGLRVTLNSFYYSDGDGFIVPAQNKTFLIVNMTITNISDSDQKDYNEICFAAKDVDKDFDFDNSFLNPSGAPLGSGDMVPGDTVSGEVALEVSPSSAHIRVKYTSGGGCGGDKFYWLVTP